MSKRDNNIEDKNVGNNSNEKGLDTEVINNEILEQLNEIKKMQEELKKEKEQLSIAQNELFLEKEALRMQKEDIEAELKNQKNAPVLTKEAEKKDFEEAFKSAEILKQDKVRIKIPVDKDNKDEISVPVTINGYTWVIKRGESVEVPTAVADLLALADYI